jgi:hypothetical protein
LQDGGRIRRRLIALYIFGWNTLRNAGNAPGEQLLTLAGQLLFFVEAKDVELLGVKI